MGFRLVVLVSVILCACGGSTTTTRPARTVAARPAPPPAAPEPAPAPPPVMRTRGLTGSLSVSAVRNTVEPRLEEFAECFSEYGRRLRPLSGRIQLKFHVRADGRVRDAYAIDSTVGHRAVERCIVEVAFDMRFPRPQGGSAEATWPLELDVPSHVREPTYWDPSRVEGVVRRRAPRLMRRCRVDGSFQVTTYVSRRGRVIAAGAVAQSRGVEERELDCVARTVRTWRMPANGGRLAKVTFAIR